MTKQFILLGLSVCLLSSQLMALEYFRYTDESGKVVIDYTIPPQYIKQGYEVVNSMGIVIKEVLPAKSDAEMIQENAERLQQAALEEEKRVLARKYRSPGDVDAALRSKLAILDHAIEGHERRIERFKQLYLRRQSQAAKAERNNQDVASEITDDIEFAQSKIEQQQQSIVDKRQQQRNLKVQFKKDRELMRIVYSDRYYMPYEESDDSDIEALYTLPELPTQPLTDTAVSSDEVLQDSTSLQIDAQSQTTATATATATTATATTTTATATATVTGNESPTDTQAAIEVESLKLRDGEVATDSRTTMDTP